MKLLQGVVCATITPMLPDNSVDYESAGQLYRYLGEKGINCLYPNGTNGESISLTYEERCKLDNICLKVNEGKCAIYAQCGAATVDETRRNIAYAKEIGADGVGIMTPVFFPTDENSLEEYYELMLQTAGDTPAYVYNIPSRTGNDVSPNLLGRLVKKYSNLYGIKYSAPDLLRINSYIRCSSDRRVGVLIGCDSCALPCMSIGGAGWVSGPAAVFAEVFVELYGAIKDCRYEEAKKKQEVIIDLSRKLTGIPEIPAIKYMLVKRGVIKYDNCRAPLRSLTQKEKDYLDVVLNDYMKEYGC